MPTPRLLLISQPTVEVERHMSAAVERHGLDLRLGDAMFPASNWHQTWSDRYPDTPSMRSTPKRVGAQIAAEAFTMVLNRIGGREHWAFFGQGHPVSMMCWSRYWPPCCARDAARARGTRLT